MNRTHLLSRRDLLATTLTTLVSGSVAASAQEKDKQKGKHPGTTAYQMPESRLPPILWRDPGPVSSLDLFYGPGGRDHFPSGKLVFEDEDKDGTSPKFNVLDEKGERFKVKLGEEAQPETAGTRLLWAAGYFVDEDYYVSELKVEQLPKLSRGNSFVSDDGLIRGARLERKIKGLKKVGNWDWFRNPFTGTKELAGLRIMMALMNNWDLKTINNAIYIEKGERPRYVVSDVGATFGKTGNSLTRSKNNPGDFEHSKFVRSTTADHVDFVLNSRPFFLSAIDVSNYATRTHMESVVRDIPIEHARWLGQRLALLSPQQIADCFRAADYSAEDSDRMTRIVRNRIAELTQL